MKTRSYLATISAASLGIAGLVGGAAIATGMTTTAAAADKNALVLAQASPQQEYPQTRGNGGEQPRNPVAEPGERRPAGDPVNGSSFPREEKGESPENPVASSPGGTMGKEVEGKTDPYKAPPTGKGLANPRMDGSEVENPVIERSQ